MLYRTGVMGLKQGYRRKRLRLFHAVEAIHMHEAKLSGHQREAFLVFNNKTTFILYVTIIKRHYIKWMWTH